MSLLTVDAFSDYIWDRWQLVTLVTTHFITNLFCCPKLLVCSIKLRSQTDMCQLHIIVHIVAIRRVS